MAEDPGDREGPPAPIRRLALRIVAGLAAIVSIVALWSGERVRIADDLQLFAESSARPGETLALRALVLRDVEGVAGPRLEKADVHVRLLDAADRELASTQLRPTQLDSMEGSLRVPELAHGRLVLEASLDAMPAEHGPAEHGPAEHGVVDPDALTVRRSLQVRPTTDPGLPVSRSAGPLQHFALGRVHAIGTAIPPTPFEPRVISGSCAPEQRCTLLVWVGEPAAALEVQPSPAFTQVGAIEPASETDGLAAVTLQVHGAEAEVTLRASRAGQPVAERAVRLPVALGEAVVAADRAIVSSLPALRLTLIPPPGREHLILDTFVQGRWSQTRTVSDATPSAETHVDAIPSASGIVRIQARSDRYSAEGSGTRAIYLQPPGESMERSLGAIARGVRNAGLSDAASELFGSMPPPGATHDALRWAAFLLAPLELSRMPIPLAVSDRPVRLARLAGVRTFLRFGLGAMLVFCALVVGASLLRSGFAASEQAGLILEEGREPGHPRARPASRLTGRLAGRLWVLVWVALVCMAFLTAALLVVAKPLWF